MIDLDVEIYQHLNEQIKINKLCYLSSGDDSDTFLCNEQYVVKVPKRDSVRFAQKREFELYRFLENCNYPFEISPPSERCCWVLLKPRKPLKIRQFIHAKAL